jgi:hypothetical protein
MSRDKMKELACPDFSVDFVVLCFHHTANYPNPVGQKNHTKLTEFMALHEVLLELQNGVATPETTCSLAGCRHATVAITTHRVKDHPR